MASKKPAKKPDAKVKAAALIRKVYRLGYVEGQAERQKFVNTLRTTNGYLWRELCRMDDHEPDEGLRLSTAFAERLIAALQRSKRNKYYIEELRKRIDRSNLKLKKLVKILDGCR